VEDETTKRSHGLYRHVLGSAEPDHLLYEETDERFRIAVERTRSGAFLLLTIASHTASEVRYLRADQPRENFGSSLRVKTTMNITLTIIPVRLPRNISGRHLIRMRECFTFARIPAGAPSA